VHFITQITQWLEALIDKVPLPLFVGLGAFLEEVIAPIPSPSLLTLTGSVAASKGLVMYDLLLLSILGAIGKALGGWILYYLGDVAEDVILKKWGKFFGISHTHVENFGKRFHKGHWDIWVLTAIRALPIIPSAPVSIACGIIKLDLKVYLLGTFLGNIPRNLIFMYLGYSGVQIVSQLINHLDRTESLVQLAIFASVLGLIIWSYWKRGKQHKE
jgi:membrane protein DedA with SNARE-associated domain